MDSNNYFDFGQDVAAESGDDDHEQVEGEPENLFTFIPSQGNLDDLADAINHFNGRLKVENRGELCAILLRAMLTEEPLG